jgi:hypothetical protein
MKEVGPRCGEAVATLLKTKPHPEQGYRACLGIMRLARHYGAERLEAACRRAVALDACTYQSIKSILATGADRQPVPSLEQAAPGPALLHENLRGPDYYAPTQPADDSQQRGIKIWPEARSSLLDDPTGSFSLERTQTTLKP